ncbi:MAG: hypothetical protein ACKOOL_01260 [Novosphingobium sp.]
MADQNNMNNPDGSNQQGGQGQQQQGGQQGTQQGGGMGGDAGRTGGGQQQAQENDPTRRREGMNDEGDVEGSESGADGDGSMGK